jgi:hypothetical protein
MTSELILSANKLEKMKWRLTIPRFPHTVRPKTVLLSIPWPILGFGSNFLKHWPPLIYLEPSIRLNPVKNQTNSPILTRYRDMRPNLSSQGQSSGRCAPSVATLGRSSTYVSPGGPGCRLCLTGRGGDSTKKASVNAKRLNPINDLPTRRFPEAIVR